MIELTNITKSFHELVAVDNVSMTIPDGEVLGLLGPNGAGKTTLFRLVAGFLNPDRGHIRSRGHHWPQIGYKPERLLFPNHLRVGQYLRMVASLCNLGSGDAEAAVLTSLRRLNLLDAADKKIKECSKGMRQRLALAQAIIGNPPLLLLDEPSNGLDPEGQADICRHIKSLHQRGTTVVLASHQLPEVTQVCTLLVILNQGAIHYENRMSDALAERPHATIQVDKDASPLGSLLHSLHDSIFVDGCEIVLSKEASSLRRRVMSILLAAGYDIVSVEQKRVTLAEIYAEAVQ